MAEMSAALHDADKLSRMGKVEELKATIRRSSSPTRSAAWKNDIAAELKLEKEGHARHGHRASAPTAVEDIRRCTSCRAAP